MIVNERKKQKTVKGPLQGETAGYPAILLELLKMRGISGHDEVERFLNPSLDMLHDPFLMDGMDTAVKRIREAIDDHEKICIYGDYDVDGITSVAVLYDFLDSMGADVVFYIPERQKDGYGLSIDALARLTDGGITLIVTTDCGTTSLDEVAYLNGRGVDTIVTDHHECKERLPAACAVLNPSAPGSGYPFRQLSGVGVVYKFISAICSDLDISGRERGYLDLVAVGTVADAVSMTGENRVIVSFGLRKLNSTPNLGLDALIKSSMTDNRTVDEETVGYVIAPRINAAGRMGDPSDAVRLLLTDDKRTARRISEDLCRLNRERQLQQGGIVSEVEEILMSDPAYSDEKVLVVSGTGWNGGIIGIVASIIAEKYGKPTLVITLEGDGRGKGSGRSAGRYNLFDALNDSSELLTAFGGHEKAAGFSIDPENIDLLRKKINNFKPAGDILDMISVNDYDIILNDEYVDVGTVEAINWMAPYGEGNPRPVFAYLAVKVSEINTCGNDKRHLKLKLDCRNVSIDCIAFNHGVLYKELNFGDRIDVFGYLQINEWRDKRDIQIQAAEIRRGAG